GCLRLVQRRVRHQRSQRGEIHLGRTISSNVSTKPCGPSNCPLGVLAVSNAGRHLAACGVGGGLPMARQSQNLTQWCVLSVPESLPTSRGQNRFHGQKNGPSVDCDATPRCAISLSVSES